MVAGSEYGDDRNAILSVYPLADARGRTAAEISGDPQALASALAKIDAYARGIPMHTADAHPETAQMMIMNPLSGGGLRGLFSTHPATEERIARLNAIAAGR